jgi:hypothetical protein
MKNCSMMVASATLADSITDVWFGCRETAMIQKGARNYLKINQKIEIEGAALIGRYCQMRTCQNR